jgi:receptor protein-tyrosine kinase
MSLIERAADILPAETDAGLGRSKDRGAPSDTIDRVVSQEGHLGRSVKESHPAKVRQDTATRVSRTLNIDLNKLRQQNVLTPNEERTAISENFRRIKRHILKNVASPNGIQRPNLVMITSALPGEGKTFCTVNLAISIAMEVDLTVLLVDADVARPSITNVLGIKGDVEKGLMDVLLGTGVDVSEVIYRTSIPKLSVMPAGTQHARATEVVASERMRLLLDEMSERYPDRVIIFDSPPLLAASEAGVLASHMGQVLVVVEAGRTTETTLKDALARIESSNVLGVLLNKGGAPGAGQYGGYGYGYGYGYGSGA